jgi:hypothetical protein
VSATSAALTGVLIFAATVWVGGLIAVLSLTLLALGVILGA